MADANFGNEANINPADPERVRPLRASGFDREARDQMADLKVWVKVMLGEPRISVELTNLALNAAITITLDEYNKWLARRKMDVIDPVFSGIQSYNLKELKKPFGRGITKIDFTEREQFFSPVGGVFSLGIPTPIAQRSLEQFDIALRYIETARRVFSSEPGHLWEEPILFIFAPEGFGIPLRATYTYYEHVRIGELPDYHHNWIRKYALAWSKIALGHVRRKFNSVPGPQGGDINLDGAELVTEGNDATQRLEEEIMKISHAVEPLIY